MQKTKAFPEIRLSTNDLLEVSSRFENLIHERAVEYAEASDCGEFREFFRKRHGRDPTQMCLEAFKVKTSTRSTGNDGENHIYPTENEFFTEYKYAAKATYEKEISYIEVHGYEFQLRGHVPKVGTATAKLFIHVDERETLVRISIGEQGSDHKELSRIVDELFAVLEPHPPKSKSPLPLNKPMIFIGVLSL